MFRALAVLRVVVLVNAVGLNLYRAGNFDHPGAGVACVVVMVGWTGAMIWAYAAPVRRSLPLLVADLAVALSLMALTPVVKGPDWNATITGFWVIGVLMAWAIRLHWVGGLVAGVLLGGTDLLLRDTISQTSYGNVFLLLIGGPIVGFLAASLQQMAVERDRAERRAATAAERARLARVVHDGVLQVLALVQRRGTELGGEAAELGRLAGEQEEALRTLIRSQDSLQPATAPGVADLAERLGRLGSRPGVTVVDAGHPGRAAGGAGRRGRRRRRRLPRQRAGPRRRRRTRLGAAGGAAGPGRAVGARRGSGHPRGTARAGRGRRPARRRAVDPWPGRRPRGHRHAQHRSDRHRVGDRGARPDASGADDMTIHTSHPFADPDPDPARRLRGRLGGAVSLWTSGDDTSRAGLTVASLMVAGGEPARVLALVDPDSDLADEVARTGRAVVQLLSWAHRDLAEAFAGAAPAPGGPFRMAAFEATDWGPRLRDATSYAHVTVESSVEVGWSLLVTAAVDEIAVGDDPQPLEHRRGRYLRPEGA